MIGLDDFFADYQDSRTLFDVVLAAMDAIGPAEVRIMKSQIVFRHKRDFAWIWVPTRYLKGHMKNALLVLSLHFPERDSSPRWKEVVEPYPGRFMHHLEIFSAAEVDGQVHMWLVKAWDLAG